jgi:hypothetical protein
MEYPDSPEYLMDEPAFEAHKKHELCKFTSPLFRTRAIIPLAQRRAKLLPALPQPDDKEVVSWSNDGCERGKAWGSPACPHSLNWMYSVMDGRLGEVCQGRSSSPIQAAMRKFTSPQAWVSGWSNSGCKLQGVHCAASPLTMACTAATAPPGHCAARRLSQDAGSLCALCIWSCHHDQWTRVHGALGR